MNGYTIWLMQIWMLAVWDVLPIASIFVMHARNFEQFNVVKEARVFAEPRAETEIEDSLVRLTAFRSTQSKDANMTRGTEKLLSDLNKHTQEQAAYCNRGASNSSWVNYEASIMDGDGPRDLSQVNASREGTVVTPALQKNTSMEVMMGGMLDGRQSFVMLQKLSKRASVRNPTTY